MQTPVAVGTDRVGPSHVPDTIVVHFWMIPSVLVVVVGVNVGGLLIYVWMLKCDSVPSMVDLIAPLASSSSASETDGVAVIPVGGQSTIVL